MASRRSRTTRPLFAHVAAAWQTLQVLAAVGGNSTAFGLIARYVTGLVLLDARQTQPRSSEPLPARGHDARNRLRRTRPLSTQALLRGLVGVARHLSWRLGTLGYLGVDDVVLEQPLATLLPWAAWTSSHAKKQQGSGCHVVLLSWASDPAGTWRIPVAFRVWRPKRSCAPPP